MRNREWVHEKYAVAGQDDAGLFWYAVRRDVRQNTAFERV